MSNQTPQVFHYTNGNGLIQFHTVNKKMPSFIQIRKGKGGGVDKKICDKRKAVRILSEAQEVHPNSQ
jgi:hypothetical protein